MAPIPRRHPPMRMPPLPRPPVVPPPTINVSVRDSEKPMTVARYAVDAQVNGLFATVSTTIAFANPNGRVLEGELEFPLPEGASVCGYALDVNGRMREGVVVKKDEARIAFEAEVKAGVDPGIVEHVKGNLWKTRIYPIPANGSRTIRVDYVTPLVFGDGGDAAIQLPMPREKIAERKIDITVPIRANIPPPTLGGLGDRRFAKAEAVWRTSETDRDVTPGEDVVVALPQLPATFAAVERCGSECWFAASATADAVQGTTRYAVGEFRILWDASGSRKPADVAKAREMLACLPNDVRCSLVVFRDVPEAERTFASSSELIAALDSVAYDGGTDFAALAKAVAAKKEGAVTLLFTDGMDTLSGDGDAIALDALALVSGGEKDVEWLRLMCGGRVIDLATATKETVMREVYQPSRFVAGVEGDGVDLLQGVGQMAVGRVTVLGRLAADSATIRIDFGGGVKSGPIALAKSDAKDGRTIACARAAKRIAQLSPRADDNEAELLALGREYGLASPKTSLIVLDTLAQYMKHKIEPPASEPELHAEWAKRQPNPEQAKKREANAASSWLANLKRGWEERVAWHKDPIPKRKTPKSGLFPAAAEPVGAAPADGAVADRAVTRVARPPAAAMRVNAAARRERRALVEEASGAGAPMAAAMEEAAPAEAQVKAEHQPEANASVKLAAWDPKTPYLQSLKDCAAAHDGKGAPADMLYRRYMELRAKSASSPAFYLDCAGFFFKRGEKTIALRILSNLAELKIEDPSLLRTFAWRLREAGEYDRAIQVLRKVAKLRPEEPHSFRDLALVLTERAKDGGGADDATEAMGLLKKTAFTPWKRQNAQAVAVFAVEELNALIVWCERNDWKGGKKPDVPELDKEFRYLIDVDVRIILSWDADNTDIDIHVLEPNGEEAYYQNRRTASGGFVSQDITTGYGPEEYLQLKGQTGVYKVLTHYFGSSQQRLTGPATATATVYTNWARPGEKRQILSLRLDKPKEKVTVGEIEFGK
jgi:tetratricopeptide (TPR) repeat protein